LVEGYYSIQCCGWISKSWYLSYGQTKDSIFDEDRVSDINFMCMGIDTGNNSDSANSIGLDVSRSRM